MRKVDRERIEGLPDFIGFCSYCKQGVFKGDSYIDTDHLMLHMDPCFFDAASQLQHTTTLRNRVLGKVKDATATS